MTSKIILEELKIYAFHGALPEENLLGTYFLVNVELHADLWKASETDRLEDTINYAEVNDIIHHEMEKNSHLLEHAVGRMIKKIASAYPQISYVKIKLTKTQPPMKGEMKGVSIEMEKEL